MTVTIVHRPQAVLALVVLEVFFGVMGIISGMILMADPSGALIGSPSSVAERIPFQNFFLVGLFVENLLIGLDYPATYMTIILGLAIFVALILPSTRRYFAEGYASSGKS